MSKESNEAAHCLDRHAFAPSEGLGSLGSGHRFALLDSRATAPPWSQIVTYNFEADNALKLEMNK